MKPDAKEIISLIRAIKKEEQPQYIDLSHLLKNYITENGDFGYMNIPQ